MSPPDPINGNANRAKVGGSGDKQSKLEGFKGKLFSRFCKRNLSKVRIYSNVSFAKLFCPARRFGCSQHAAVCLARHFGCSQYSVSETFSHESVSLARHFGESLCSASETFSMTTYVASETFSMTTYVASETCRMSHIFYFCVADPAEPGRFQRRHSCRREEYSFVSVDHPYLLLSLTPSSGGYPTRREGNRPLRVLIPRSLFRVGGIPPTRGFYQKRGNPE